MVDTRAYVQYFSQSAFWDKLRRYGRVAGREVVEKALILFYASRAEGVPRWAKMAMLGALGYLIFPADLIPDFLPALGFTDDLGVMAAALLTIASYVTPDIRQKAHAQAKAWLGD